MTKKMLIDAAHPEEVRVALLDQGKVEDFDFESAARKPLRGNIFLARVTRVEPSLQAAFVEYGGNRHGFLAFSEIHPDYYQIPVSDRELLREAEAEVADLAAKLELTQRGDEEDEPAGDNDNDEEDNDEKSATSEDDDQELNRNSEEVDVSSLGDAEVTDDSSNRDDHSAIDEDTDEEEEEEEEDTKATATAEELNSEDSDEDPSKDEADTTKVAADEDTQNADDEQVDVASDEIELDDSDEAQTVEAVDAADSDQPELPESSNISDADSENVKKETKKAKIDPRAELFEQYKEAKRKRSRLLRNYKIQEVIKRRQILLVQVVKEERGGKGAALTTYMSLAGRYGVLMPNTARGGGISRKIAAASDRKRLRRVVDSLEVPQGMGLIIRTAGAKRTKIEIKRDYDYLLRLWENIRTLTLSSVAPCLIYEEASLIKRAIRDLYDKDISSVLVEGEAGYREAKDFIKMLMPSHAKNVQPYKEREPIFLKHNVENQLDGMYQPTVRLKSGGYIVIHQTEALVAIDVNSGRSTRERNIELTALKTNIEAAQEAARQFRLRDLAGLIVLDFIDMEEPKNNRKVEKALKEALKTDRARIQVGRISNFGLLEMSRQRRRSGIIDGTTHICPTCSGAGAVRSHEIAALRILRAIEGEAISGKVGRVTARTSLDVSMYILNHNRDWLERIENANGVKVEILADSEKAGDAFDLEKSGTPSEVKTESAIVRPDQIEPVEVQLVDGDDGQSSPKDASSADQPDGERKKRRRRRRRKSANATNEAEIQNSSESDSASKDETDGEIIARADGGSTDDEAPKKKRRRGRRGGRRNRRGNSNVEAQSGTDGQDSSISEVPSPSLDEKNSESSIEPTSVNVTVGSPSFDEPGAPKAATASNGASNGAAEKEEKPSQPTKVSTEKRSDIAADSTPNEDAEPVKKPSRKGWWQRAIG